MSDNVDKVENFTPKIFEEVKWMLTSIQLDIFHNCWNSLSSCFFVNNEFGFKHSLKINILKIWYWNFYQILPRLASAFFHPQWFSTKILEYRRDQLEKREHNKPTDSTCDTQLHLLRTEMKTGFYRLLWKWIVDIQ